MNVEVIHLMHTVVDIIIIFVIAFMVIVAENSSALSAGYYAGTIDVVKWKQTSKTTTPFGAIPQPVVGSARIDDGTAVSFRLQCTDKGTIKIRVSVENDELNSEKLKTIPVTEQLDTYKEREIIADRVKSNEVEFISIYPIGMLVTGAEHLKLGVPLKGTDKLFQIKILTMFFLNS